jgi:hypothetical protein
MIFGIYLDPKNETTLIECYSFRFMYQNEDNIVVKLTQTDGVAEKKKNHLDISSNSMYTKEEIKRATVASLGTCFNCHRPSSLYQPLNAIFR